MSEQTDIVLARVAEETFEALTFMYPVGEDESPAGASVSAEVTYDGPSSGRLVLTVSQNMLPAVATNMLGLEFDEVATPDQQTDALREVLNVICGNLLPALYSQRDVFNVAAPQVLSPAQAPQVDGLQLAGTAKLYLDAGQAQVQLYARSADGQAKVA